MSTLHALDNIRPTFAAFENLGLHPSKAFIFYKPYAYPAKDQTLAFLKQRGYRCAPLSSLEEPSTLCKIEAEVADAASNLLLVEDGGHVFSHICASRPSLLKALLGVVEQTTKGIRRITHAIETIGWEMPCPVLSLPDSKMKQTIEPPHIARGLVKAIDAITDDSLPGQTVSVLGCGVIGMHIIHALARLGCQVRAYDPNLLQCGQSQGAFEVRETAAQAVRGARFVIGASGELSICPAVIDSLEHRSVVVSASSDRVELDFEYLERLAVDKRPFYHPHFLAANGDKIPLGTSYTLAHTEARITLLGDGYPLNFLGFGGMADKTAQVVLAMIVVGASSLAAGHYAGEKGILRNAFDVLDNEYAITKTFLQWSRL